MIAARRAQRSFADGVIAEEVADLWEPWMRQADQVLEDHGLLTVIQQELARRIKKGKTRRGRPGTPNRRSGVPRSDDFSASCQKL